MDSIYSSTNYKYDYEHEMSVVPVCALSRADSQNTRGCLTRLSSACQVL